MAFGGSCPVQGETMKTGGSPTLPSARKRFEQQTRCMAQGKRKLGELKTYLIGLLEWSAILDQLLSFPRAAQCSRSDCTTARIPNRG